MKVVINGCYGGFSLSPEAQLRYVQLKNNGTLYFYKKTKYIYRDGVSEYEQFHPTSNGSYSYFNFAVLNDLGPVVQEDSTGCIKDAKFFYDRDLDRDDPVLVQVVEEMGAAANGSYASLEVIEIPDDVSWAIKEYDGNEWVAESHRTWD